MLCRSPGAAYRAVAVVLVFGTALSACIDDPGKTAGGSVDRVSAIVSTSTTMVATPSTSSVGARELSDDELVDAVRPSIVRVRQTSCRSVAVGSGFMLRPGQFITNRHVVDGGGKVELLSWDGRDLPVQRVATSQTSDLAFVSASLTGFESRFSALPIRTGRVATGERLAVIGFPEAGPLTISTGVVVGYDAAEPGDASEVIKATTVVKHGNSGGPVLDMKGRVVGVIYAERIRDDDALIIPISDATDADPNLLVGIDPDC